jgi:glutamine amidotransferase
VHSYAGDLPDGHCDIVAHTTHGSTFVSAVSHGNLVGVQFHPERSGADGLRLLHNFVALVRAA